jgi:DNA-directed RNA polymerase beta subunit
MPHSRIAASCCAGWITLRPLVTWSRCHLVTRPQVYEHRTDTKLYRLTSPQSPIARTRLYDALAMDDYPQGTNMVVAVAAYTGYDMEDAMILNKAAVERGLAHGMVFKTTTIDLEEQRCAPRLGDYETCFGQERH